MKSVIVANGSLHVAIAGVMGAVALDAFHVINAANAERRTTIKPYNLLKYCRQHKFSDILQAYQRNGVLK